MVPEEIAEDAKLMRLSAKDKFGETPELDEDLVRLDNEKEKKKKRVQDPHLRLR